ncbi:hypothetical protein [Algiphilus sp.]|uniref:hypothetical protein n=1 Tax=Algiphilus sp. TaxID=1872431 RepID=UPI0025B89479|nr:hypothetical protein [Algiphilus sp.]MCK5770927.1 hypothetical protein [Algiphilus sp.]
MPGALKVYGLAALLAAAAGVWGYIQHVQSDTAEARLETAREREARARDGEKQARQALAEATQATNETLQRLDALSAAITAQREHLTQLREATRHVQDRIRRSPDDGCLDRPVPERLRQLPGAPAADRARARDVPRAADAAGPPDA